MQHTPVRIATLTLAGLLALAVLTAACGQVTGLSNDYLFDLTDGGATTGDASGDAAATDGAKADAPTDATADTGGKCSVAQRTSAQLSMSQLNGSMTCKDCLATSCCTDVVTCTDSSDCKRAFECRLDCTTKTGLDRHDCFTSCANGGNTSSAFTNGLGACSSQSCKTECAFQ